MSTFVSVRFGNKVVQDNPLAKIFCGLLFQIALALIVVRHDHSDFDVLIAGLCSVVGIILSVRMGWKALFVLSILTLISGLLESHAIHSLQNALLDKNAVHEGRLVETHYRDQSRTELLIDLTMRILPLAGKQSGRIRVTIAERCFFTEGSILRFRTKLSEPKSFDNPGVFDYKSYLWRKDIHATSFLQTCSDVSVVEKSDPNWIIRQRQKIIYPLMMNQNSVDENTIFHQDVLSALLLGTTTLPSEFRQQINRMGLAHLFAISGSHFAVMCVLLYALISFFLGLVSRVYLIVPRQKIAAGFSLLFVLYFFLIAERNASITRACIMVGLALFAKIIARKINWLYVLLSSAYIVLWLKPSEIFDVSFQLSYLCVLILLLVYPVFENLILGRIFKFISWRRVADFCRMAGLSILIQFYLIPYMALIFGQISVAGFFHNLWAVPVFDGVIVPFTFFYLVMTSISPFAHEVLFPIWQEILGSFVLCLDYFDSLFSWSLNIFSPHVEVVVVFYVGTLFGFYRKSLRIVLTGFALTCLLLSYVYFQTNNTSDMRITQFDVDQGDAVLVQMAGRNILVDAGGHAYFHLGEMVLWPALRHLWVDRLDLVVLTHADLDHYAGLEKLLDYVEVKKVWVSQFWSRDSRYNKLIEKIRAKRIPLLEVREGQVATVSDGSKIQVLWPKISSSVSTNENEQSLVVLFSTAKAQFLTTGDITGFVEAQLSLASEEKLKILKVSHHGSRTSTSDRLLQKFIPQHALIGVGERSRFGHPHASVMKRLLDNRIKIYRTDMHGTTQIDVIGDQAEIQQFQ